MQTFLDPNNVGSDGQGSPIQGDSFDNGIEAPQRAYNRPVRSAPPSDDAQAKVRQFVDNIGKAKQLQSDIAEQGGLGGYAQKQAKDKLIQGGANALSNRLSSPGSQGAVQNFADKWKDTGSATEAGKELAKEKIKKEGIKQLQNRVSNPYMKAGLGMLNGGVGDKGEVKEKVRQFAKDKLKEKAKDFAKDAAKKAAKNVTKQVGKQVAKQGSKVAVGAVVGAVETGAAFTGVGLLIDILVDIALYLGFNDAFEGVEMAAKGHPIEAEKLFVKAGMSVLMGFILLLGLIFAFSPPYFLAPFVFVPLTIYAIAGSVFKNNPALQGLKGWMKAIVFLYDAIALYIFAGFLAGLLYFLCSTNGLLGGGSIAETVTSTAVSLYSWFTKDPVAAAVRDACKYISNAG